jgi:hypothetical protein
MCSLNWAALNNLKTSQLVPTRHRIRSASQIESSIINHILGKPADWPLVDDEKTYEWSGSEIASSDHNLLSIDLTLNPSKPPGPLPHAAPDSVNDRFAPQQEYTFRTHVLIDNKHDEKSRALALKLCLDPELTPREVNATQLEANLPDLRKAIAALHTVTVTVTANLFQHELQKSLHPSPVVSRLLRRPVQSSPT